MSAIHTPKLDVVQWFILITGLLLFVLSFVMELSFLSFLNARAQEAIFALSLYLLTVWSYNRYLYKPTSQTVTLLCSLAVAYILEVHPFEGGFLVVITVLACGMFFIYRSTSLLSLACLPALMAFSIHFSYQLLFDQEFGMRAENWTVMSFHLLIVYLTPVALLFVVHYSRKIHFAVSALAHKRSNDC